MVAEETTGFSGVPSTYAYPSPIPLASYRDKTNLLRTAARPVTHVQNTQGRIAKIPTTPHRDLHYVWGDEAAARLSYLEPTRFSDKLDSIGKAIPGVTLRILNASAGKYAGPGGGNCAAGSNIMQGYWKDPEGTAKVL